MRLYYRFIFLKSFFPYSSLYFGSIYLNTSCLSNFYLSFPSNFMVFRLFLPYFRLLLPYFSLLLRYFRLLLPYCRLLLPYFRHYFCFLLPIYQGWHQKTQPINPKNLNMKQPTWKNPIKSRKKLKQMKNPLYPGGLGFFSLKTPVFFQPSYLCRFP